MERNEILKALEYCINNDLCDNCPVGVSKCHIIEDALSLIKELTEENERLRSTTVVKLIAKPMDEEERKRVLAELKNAPIQILTDNNQTKADTVRKMQERLKADAVTIQDHTGKLGVVVGVGNIDDVAREMEESVDEG